MDASELIRSADLTDPDDRMELADLLEEEGRDTEAALCRSDVPLVLADGQIVENTVWQLEMSDDGGSTETVKFDSEPDEDEITDAISEWVRSGDWGAAGCEVSVRYTVFSPSGEKSEQGCQAVEIEPNHASLIAAATHGAGCGTDPDDHDWTSEGEDGCSINPGVWETGGNSLTITSHCRVCGLRRTERTVGAQRHPGEVDTTTYEMPDSWCSSHQCEDCEECE